MKKGKATQKSVDFVAFGRRMQAGLAPQAARIVDAKTNAIMETAFGSPKRRRKKR